MSQETMKAHCPRCDGERNCTIHGALDEPWEWTDGVHSVNGQNDHRILRCMGCDTVFYWKSSCDSESWEGEYDRHGNQVISHPSDIKTFPPPEAKDERPDWIWDLSTIDPQLYDILTQTYVAFQNDGLILASVGLRTALDRATEFLKINPGLSLEKKVKALLENGFVGEAESRILATVADAGSAAAHRGWSPDKKEFRTLAAALEQFIHRTVIQGQSALDIKAKIPPRHVC